MGGTAFFVGDHDVVAVVVRRVQVRLHPSSPIMFPRVSWRKYREQNHHAALNAASERSVAVAPLFGSRRIVPLGRVNGSATLKTPITTTGQACNGYWRRSRCLYVVASLTRLLAHTAWVGARESLAYSGRAASRWRSESDSTVGSGTMYASNFGCDFGFRSSEITAGRPIRPSTGIDARIIRPMYCGAAAVNIAPSPTAATLCTPWTSMPGFTKFVL